MLKELEAENYVSQVDHHLDIKYTNYSSMWVPEPVEITTHHLVKIVYT